MTDTYPKNFDEALDDLVESYLEDESSEEIIAALAAKIEDMLDAEQNA